MILKTIEKNSWVSPNKKWKILYHIFDQGGLIQADIIVSKLNKYGRYNVVYSKNKLPQYVAVEKEAIKHYVDAFRYPNMVQRQTEEVKKMVEEVLQEKKKEELEISGTVTMNIYLISKNNFKVVVDYGKFKQVSKMTFKDVKKEIEDVKKYCLSKNKKLSINWF